MHEPNLDGPPKDIGKKIKQVGSRVQSIKFVPEILQIIVSHGFTDSAIINWS